MLVVVFVVSRMAFVACNFKLNSFNFVEENTLFRAGEVLENISRHGARVRMDIHAFCNYKQVKIIIIKKYVFIKSSCATDRHAFKPTLAEGRCKIIIY